MKAWNYILWKGDLKSSLAVLQKAPKKVESDWLWWWSWQEMYERDYDAMLRMLTSSPIESFDNDFPKGILVGLAYRFSHKPGLAERSFDGARIWLEKQLKQRPDDPDLHRNLGLAYSGLGWKEEAIREGKRALELLRAPGDRDSYLLDLARIYVFWQASTRKQSPKLAPFSRCRSGGSLRRC